MFNKIRKDILNKTTINLSKLKLYLINAIIILIQF